MTAVADEAQRIHAADAAERALRDHLQPAFATVEALYIQRLASVAASEPWAVDKLRSLALALKVSQEVRSHIEAVVADGPVAQAAVKHLRKIEALSPERRRILGI